MKYKSKKNVTEKHVVDRVQQQRELKAVVGLVDLPEQDLMPFSGSSKVDIHRAFPFTIVREGKRSTLRADAPPPFLQRLGSDPDHWLKQVQHFNQRARPALFYNAFGQVSMAKKQYSNGTFAQGSPEVYYYNALNQRAVKIAPTKTTRYIYAADGTLLAEANGADVTVVYVYLAGELVGLVRNQKFFAIHTDHLGRPFQAVRVADGKTVWKATNTAFGRKSAALYNGGASDFVELNVGLPGQYLDKSTGLWYNWHRYYSQELGRYLQSDPIGLEGGVNLYAYAGGNPVSYFDSNGLKVEVVGSEFFRLSAGLALEKIKSKPNGLALYNYLSESKKNHTIVFGERNRCKPARGYEQGKGKGSTIYWNPQDIDSASDTSGFRLRPAFIGLAHEMGHAESIDGGTQPPRVGAPIPGTTPPHEVNSLFRENQVRTEHGFQSRPYYYSSP